MGFVDVTGVRHTLSDGRVLLEDVSSRVGEGVRAALVGENGAGKTTLLRIVAGDLVPEAGAVARSGGLAVMRQFIGSVRDGTTVQWRPTTTPRSWPTPARSRSGATPGATRPR